MAKLQYLVRVTQGRGDHWGASVPDLLGCVAVASSIDELLERIRAAVELQLRGMLEDGIEPRHPRQRALLPNTDARGLELYASIAVSR